MAIAVALNKLNYLNDRMQLLKTDVKGAETNFAGSMAGPGEAV